MGTPNSIHDNSRRILKSLRSQEFVDILEVTSLEELLRAQADIQYRWP